MDLVCEATKKLKNGKAISHFLVYSHKFIYRDSGLQYNKKYTTEEETEAILKYFEANPDIDMDINGLELREIIENHLEDGFTLRWNVE